MFTLCLTTDQARGSHRPEEVVEDLEPRTEGGHGKTFVDAVHSLPAPPLGIPAARGEAEAGDAELGEWFGVGPGSWFALGGLVPEVTARAPEVAEILGHAGTVEVVDDIRSAKWMKLVVNAGELVPCAILGEPMHAVEATPGMLPFMLAASQEAAEAAVLAGCRIVPIFGLDVDTSDRPEFVRRLIDKVLRDYALPHTKTTVLHDWMKNRHSEVNEINGLVVQVHREHGLSAPANQLLVEIAQRIEHGELEPRAENADLLVSHHVAID